MLSEKAHGLPQVHDWGAGGGKEADSQELESLGGKNPQTQRHEFYSALERLRVYSVAPARPFSVS